MTVPLGKSAFVIVNVPPPVEPEDIVPAYNWDVVPFAASVTWAVNANDPPVDVVPLIFPELLRLKPTGIWPDARVQEYGVVPPVAASVTL